MAASLPSAKNACNDIFIHKYVGERRKEHIYGVILCTHNKRFSKLSLLYVCFWKLLIVLYTLQQQQIRERKRGLITGSGHFTFIEGNKISFIILIGFTFLQFFMYIEDALHNNNRNYFSFTKSFIIPLSYNSKFQT